MKKLAILGASAALAAMPVVGVFAAGTVTDTVEITISSSCKVGSASATDTDTTNPKFSAEVVNGGTKEWAPAAATGGKLVIACNDASGWNVKAQGYSDDTAGTTTMTPSGNGTAIATGTNLDGSVSNWAFKVAAGDTGATVTTADYTAVPADATRVAYKAGAISESTLYTGYKVGVSPTQQADTYTGKVRYTIATGVGN